MEKLNSLQQLDRLGYESPNLSVGKFKAYTNVLDIVLQYIPNNKKELPDYNKSLILIKPRYLYFEHNKINLVEIKMYKRDNVFRITDLLEKSLLIECDDIQICDTNKFISCNLFAKEKIEWFLSMPTFLELNPQPLISLNV